MDSEQLTAIRKRAELDLLDRGPDWDDFEELLAEVERLRAGLEQWLGKSRLDMARLRADRLRAGIGSG